MYDAFEARAGDSDEFRRRVEQVVHLHARLRAEQLAEAGYVPDTLEGCIAVLNVAARIVEAIRGEDA